MHNNNQNVIRADLKNMTSRDFLTLGIHQIAYIRPIIVQNRQAYAIHAADGTPLSVMDNFNTAVAMIHHNDLEAITVH